MNRREWMMGLAAPGLRAATARDDSIARTLARCLRTDQFDYLLRSVRDREPLVRSWPDPGHPAALGSLAKPFIALAYGETRKFEYPRLRCTRGECWLPRGHGEISIDRAIAHSCNAYFRQLARNVDTAALQAVTDRYGLPTPGVLAPEQLLSGYGSWRASPGVMAAAYAELAQRRSEIGVSTIFAALRLCADSGTASAARARIAAKTGTAPCLHTPASNGDGLLAAVFPAESPEYVLVVRGHGMPGAEAARFTAPFFRALGYERPK